MSSIIADYINKKNHWLQQQVAVDFPTPKSILGRDLYLKMQTQQMYDMVSMPIVTSMTWVDDVVVADMHKLTVMFALLQASALGENDKQQADLLAFFTQIIFSDDYQLILGFKAGEPVAALLYHYDEQADITVLTDIALLDSVSQQHKAIFLQDVLSYLQSQDQFSSHLIWPKYSDFD